MRVDEIGCIAVVGAGFMGHGIGQEFALVGYEVVFHDLTEEKLQQATRNIQRNLRELADWGIILAGEIQPAMDRIRTTTVLGEAAGGADLVVEAVFEDLELNWG